MWTVAEIFQLMAIASQLSGLPLVDDIPFVFEQPDKEIQQAFCAGGKYCTDVYAYTDVAHHEIHISYELNDYSRNTILVHELTHWLEWKADINQSNYCEDERVAYMTESQYMLEYEHKLDPEPTTLKCTP
jgi:hypothetical protein